MLAPDTAGSGLKIAKMMGLDTDNVCACRLMDGVWNTLVRSQPSPRRLVVVSGGVIRRYNVM